MCRRNWRSICYSTWIKLLDSTLTEFYKFDVVGHASWTPLQVGKYINCFRFNPNAADIFRTIFHSFEAGIVNPISSSK